MSSFVDLLGNDVWTEADIVNRTEAMLHSIVSPQDELILSRKMIAFSMGRLIPTPEEAELLGRYEQAAYAAQQAGIAARADMALLQAAMDYVEGEEASEEVLALVALRKPVETPPPEAPTTTEAPLTPEEPQPPADPLPTEEPIADAA